ncbi:MAG: hypothetical protein AAGJ93_06815 [Bacteroidota bacterium]
MEILKSLQPERIAFYSYAHVPWRNPSQRAYDETDLPLGEVKRALYEFGKAQLLEMGYQEVGMDHFALPQDPLIHARLNGTLHRNFMGYIDRYTELMIGLGVSSISDSTSGRRSKHISRFSYAGWNDMEYSTKEKAG